MLKPSFRFESGIEEDGREVLTSEPQREVAGDFLYIALHSHFRLDFLNCDYGCGDFAPQHECFFLSRSRPPTSLSIFFLISVQPTVSQWLACVLCDVEQPNSSCSSRGWTKEGNTICIQISIPKGRKIPINPNIMN